MLLIYCLLLLFICLPKSIDCVQPLDPVTVYIDHGTVCKPHEFKKIRGLSGYILSHDSAADSSYRPAQQCFLTIEVPEMYQISVEAVEFNLGYPPNPTECHSDSLFIFDNQPENGNIVRSNLDMLGEFCAPLKNKSVATTLAVSSNNSITLYWHAAELTKRHPNSKGFKLRWFVLKRKNYGNPPGAAATCNPDTDFLCSDGLTCIPLPLACDSVQHCSDGSDTFKRLQKSAGCENIEVDYLLADLSGAAIVGIVIGIILLLVVTVGALLYCCLSNHKRHHHSGTPIHSPNLVYQPAPTNPHSAAPALAVGVANPKAGRGGSNGSGGSDRSNDLVSPPHHFNWNNGQAVVAPTIVANGYPASYPPVINASHVINHHKIRHQHPQHQLANPNNDHVTAYNNKAGMDNDQQQQQAAYNVYAGEFMHHQRQDVV